MSVRPEDIAVALGRTASEGELPQWALWIDDALLLIEARLGTLGDLNQRRLDYVVREAVVAHIKHPDDATQVSIAVDDGSASRTYRSGRGRVKIIDEWWELLSPTPSSGAFAVDTLWAGTSHLPWCSASFGAIACSCGVSFAGEPIFEQGDL